jgi:SAM-dependent MidA family methyltransferase
LAADAIALQIQAEGGRVSFARFMELALTHPRAGYYSRSEHLLGPRGHFSTAPRLSPVFNRAVARLLAELVDSWSAVLSTDPAPFGEGQPTSVIELGGGEGDLAQAVLQVWEETRSDLRARVTYGIVEIGEGLRARQTEALSSAMNAGWRICWATTLGGAARGTRPCVVLGNEFFDALPVHLVDVRGPRALEAWVTLADGIVEGIDERREQGFREVWDDISSEVETELRALFGTTDPKILRSLSADGFIELRPAFRSLMELVGAVMPVGSLLIVDYGAWKQGLEPATTAGTPSSGDGSASGDPHRRTIRGYFRHQVVDDPYARAGFQDLTADVDFRALDLHGRAAGFDTVLFTSVAALLRCDRGEERLSELRVHANVPTSEALEADREAMVLGELLDPEGLGGTFKVMLQVREG